ncbi:MAG: hypothetical protein ACTS44_00410 [Candidatus Hodgkinia cicadicola]
MYVDGTFNVPPFRHFRRRNNLHYRAIISTYLKQPPPLPLVRKKNQNSPSSSVALHPSRSKFLPFEGTWQLPIS